MLTRKQYDLLMFIHNRIQRDGVSPSFDEMKESLDLRSKSGIHRLITALEERGFIRRLAHRARAIEVVRLPENVEGRPVRGNFRPAVIEGDRGLRDEAARFEHSLSRIGETHEIDPDTSTVPLIGRIAAGVPIEALEQGGTRVGVPSMMLSREGEHYALEVKGDSMIEAGIHDGDIVVVRRQSTAENGDIVVALIEDHEATLKRLRRKGGAIALEAANPAYGTRVYRTDQVKIQGRMVGLIRTYS
ncbi:transcriptional repressor LexA [Limibaculum sp. FT325]|uniref:transcriptional repressor LexA n=1 Tax=Thermohalobaculum sediminis TaxID=2939436 RepID=UPI0020BD7D74|nr:transcriptional repressor LexA [Limibaculum sediminis]MCL5777479.1 transcriptional repressor LexA [Limibaculum sediminis]